MLSVLSLLLSDALNLSRGRTIAFALLTQPYEAPRPKKQLQQDLDLDIVMVDILSAFSGTISKTYNTWGIW